MNSDPDNLHPANPEQRDNGMGTNDGSEPRPQQKALPGSANSVAAPDASSPSPLCVAQRGEGRGEVFSLDIPLADLSYFSSLPDTVQAQVRKRLYVMQFVFSSKKINPACKFVAANLRQFGGELSWHRIRALFYGFRDGNGKYAARDWRILVNWSRAGAATSLPPKFVEFWRMLCEQHQRVTTNAHRELLQIWRTRFDSALNEFTGIPGYAAWPVAEPEIGRAHV